MSEEKQKQALPEPVKAHLLKTRAVTENTDQAKELFNARKYCSKLTFVNSSDLLVDD